VVIWPPSGYRIHGLFSGFVTHYWEIQKVVNGHSFILNRQIAALARRALVEVCTVPVLLVYSVNKQTNEGENITSANLCWR